MISEQDVINPGIEWGRQRSAKKKNETSNFSLLTILFLNVCSISTVCYYYSNIIQTVVSKLSLEKCRVQQTSSLKVLHYLIHRFSRGMICCFVSSGKFFVVIIETVDFVVVKYSLQVLLELWNCKCWIVGFINTVQYILCSVLYGHYRGLNCLWWKVLCVEKLLCMHY